MNKVIYLALLFLILNPVYSVQLRAPPKIDYEQQNLQLLQKLTGENLNQDQISKVILLSLQNKTPVQDVINLVKEELDGSVKEFNKQTNLKQTKLDGFSNEINELQADLSAQQAIYQEINDDVTDLKRSIDLVNTAIDQNNADLIRLAEREGMIRKARDADEVAFKNRKIRDENALNALQQIIPLLESQQQANSQALLQTTVKRFQSFLQTTTKWDGPQVNNIIIQLQEIEQSLIASQEDDRSKETQSQVRYFKLLSECENLQKSTEQQLEHNQEELQQLKGELLSAENDRDDAQEQIDILNDSIDKQKEFRGKAEKAFNAKLAGIQENIDGYNKALQVLEKNESTIQQGVELGQNNAQGNQGGQQSQQAPAGF